MTPEKQQAVIARLVATKNKLWFPDYLNDLNAMHEAESMLNDDQQFRYVAILTKIKDDNDNHSHGWDIVWSHVLHISSAQRAEAFLRTLGLWEE